MSLMEAAKRSKITILVDENLEQLRVPLKALGFKTFGIPKGMPDEQIMEILEGLCLLTYNPKDFKISAVIHDFDIIDMSHVKYIDSDQTAKNTTAQSIANAVRESGFYNVRGTWMLTMHNDGKYVLSELK